MKRTIEATQSNIVINIYIECAGGGLLHACGEAKVNPVFIAAAVAAAAEKWPVGSPPKPYGLR